MAATSTAYGSCVDTWFMWLHWAPADAMMVVSDIGEQWSPHTAPAMHAEIDIIIIVWFVPEKMFTTIGMSMPKVPHEVPVAKARKAPTRNMIAGILYQVYVMLECQCDNICITALHNRTRLRSRAAM